MTFLKIFRIIIFIFIWIFCFLFLIEASLRTLGHFYLRKTSLDGLADNRIFNILCLGDSFTYGWGVETKDNYPRQLEKRLNNSDLSMTFKVFNLAVPGSSSSQHLIYLKDILKKYKKPDLIIILTGANDSWNLADSNIDEFMNRDDSKAMPRESASVKFRIFISRFRTYKMLKMIVLNLQGRTPESEIDLFAQSARYENIGWEIFRQLTEYNLTEIIKLASSKNIGLILQDYPNGNPFGHNIAKEVALRFNVPFAHNSYIFHEALKEASPKDLFIYDNSHPNKRGYSMMVEELYKIIYKMVNSNLQATSKI